MKFQSASALFLPLMYAQLDLAQLVNSLPAGFDSDLLEQLTALQNALIQAQTQQESQFNSQVMQRSFVPAFEEPQEPEEAEFVLEEPEEAEFVLEEPTVRRFKQVKSILALKLGTTEEQAKDLIDNYGCYCYALGSGLVGPHHHYIGEPKDELDNLCKNLYRAQKCVEIDVNNGVYLSDCSIEDMFYYRVENTSDIICLEKADEDGSTFTDLMNDRRECKKSICELEVDFADKIVDLVNNQGFVANPDYYGWNDSEYQLNCLRTIGNTGGVKTKDLACCGTGVDRKTYNPFVHDCCNENILAAGSC